MQTLRLSGGRSMGTLIAGIVVLGIVVIAVKSLAKDKKSGKSIQCGGECKHCGGHCGK